MFKKLTLILLSLTLVFSCLSSCGNDIKGKDAQMILPIDADPLFLDPQICSYSGALNIINSCFSGLVAIDEYGEIQPACAETYSVSSDGLTYTFNLRKDLMWKMSYYSSSLFESEDLADTFDKSLTADDFVFALKRAVLPETKSPFVASLFAIKNAEKIYSGKAAVSALGVKALDQYTVEIQLSNIDPDLLYTLTTAIAMPCNEDFFKLTQGRYGLSTKYLMYNGPFYMSNWADNANITVKKNLDYYDTENVMPSSIYFSINNEWQTRPDKVIGGTYEVSPISKSQLTLLEGKKGININSIQNSTFSMIFNCTDELLANKTLRQAIIKSMDKSILTNVGNANVATGILPTAVQVGTKSYVSERSELNFYKQDNQQAVELFKSAREQLEYKEIDLNIICPTEFETSVRELIQSWQSTLGVAFSISVQAFDEATLNKMVSEKNYQIALTNLDFSNSTANNAMQQFLSNSNANVLGFVDEKFDDIVHNITQKKTLTQIVDQIALAEQYLINEAVILPILQQETYFALGKDVSGVYFSATGEIVNFKNALRP